MEIVCILVHSIPDTNPDPNLPMSINIQKSPVLESSEIDNVSYMMKCQTRYHNQRGECYSVLIGK